MRTCPHLLEQPRVLNCDHRLIGEGSEQIDLPLGERARVGAADRNYANCFIGPHKRDGQRGAETKSAGKVAALGVLGSLGLQIGDMKRLSLEDGACRGKPARQGQRTLPNGADSGDWSLVSDEA